MFDCEAMKKLEVFFSACCYLATLALLAFCLNIFFKNENITEIKFKKFNDDPISPYPSISFCSQLTSNMLKEPKLKEFRIETNVSSYNDFLTGKFWDEKMLDINYNEATTPMENYIFYARAFETFDPELKHEGIVFQKVKVTSIPSYWRFYRCITFDLSNAIKQQIRYLTIALNNSIFTNGMFPENDKFIMSFHFPNHLFGTSIGTKWTWQIRDKLSSDLHRVFEFKITSTEVLTRRNKAGATCKHYTDLDNVYKDEWMKMVGCAPPYWKATRNYRRCPSNKQMKMFAKEAFESIQRKSRQRNKFCKTMHRA